MNSSRYTSIKWDFEGLKSGALWTCYYFHMSVKTPSAHETKCVSDWKLHVEQPTSASEVRLRDKVSCHRSHLITRLSTERRHMVVTLQQQGLCQTKISKQTGVSKCAVQPLLKKLKEKRKKKRKERTRSTVTAAVGQGNLVQQMKDTSCSLFTEIRCPAVPSAQQWKRNVLSASVSQHKTRMDLYGSTKAKKNPYVRHRNQAKRLSCA